MTGAFLAGLVAGYGVAIPVGAIAVLIMGLAARTSFRVGAAAALGVATADGLYAAVAALGGAALAAVIAPVAGPLRVVAAVVLLGLAAHTAWRALRRAPAVPVTGSGETPSASARPPADPHRSAPAEARAALTGPTGAPAAGVGSAAAPAAGDPVGDAAAAGLRSGQRRGLETPARAFAGVLALTLLNPATVVYFAALVLGRRGSTDPDLPAAMAFVLGAFLASASWQLLIAGGGTLVGRVLAGPRGRLFTALVSSTIIAALAVATLLST